MPQAIQSLFQGYKNDHIAPDSTLIHQTKHVHVRPDVAFGQMVEASYAKILDDRGKLHPNYKEVRALRPVGALVEKFKQDWAVEEIRDPDYKNKNVNSWDTHLGKSSFDTFDITVSRVPDSDMLFWVHKYEDKLYPVPLSAGGRDAKLIEDLRHYTPSQLVPWGDPNRTEDKMVPHFVEKNRQAQNRNDKVEGVGPDIIYKPIYASWSEQNWQDITRQKDRKRSKHLSTIMETYRDQDKADRATRMETESRGKKRPIEEDHDGTDDKKPKVETDTSVIEQPSTEVGDPNPGSVAEPEQSKEDLIKEENLLVVEPSVKLQ